MAWGGGGGALRSAAHARTRAAAGVGGATRRGRRARTWMVVPPPARSIDARSSRSARGRRDSSTSSTWGGRGGAAQRVICPRMNRSRGGRGGGGGGGPPPPPPPPWPRGHFFPCGRRSRRRRLGWSVHGSRSLCARLGQLRSCEPDDATNRPTRRRHGRPLAGAQHTPRRRLACRTGRSSPWVPPSSNHRALATMLAPHVT